MKTIPRNEEGERGRRDRLETEADVGGDGSKRPERIEREDSAVGEVDADDAGESSTGRRW